MFAEALQHLDAVRRMEAFRTVIQDRLARDAYRLTDELLQHPDVRVLAARACQRIDFTDLHQRVIMPAISIPPVRLVSTRPDQPFTFKRDNGVRVEGVDLVFPSGEARRALFLHGFPRVTSASDGTLVEWRWLRDTARSGAPVRSVDVFGDRDLGPDVRALYAQLAPLYAEENADA